MKMTNLLKVLLVTGGLMFVADAAKAAAVPVASWDNFGDTTTPYSADSSDSGIAATVAGPARTVSAGNAAPSVQFSGSGSGISGSVITYTLAVSGGNYVGFTTLGYQYNRSGNAASVVWSYSISGGGGSGSNFETDSLNGTAGSWITEGVTFPAITLSPGQTLTLTGVMGASGGSQTIGFDNINFNANLTPVPEPVNVAASIFGLGFLSFGIGRRCWKRRNS